MQEYSKRVSIIICTKNRPVELDRCIKTLLLQDYNSIELIIVDASEKTQPLKNGQNIIVDGAKKKTIYTMPGLPMQRNIGAKYAQGKYIAYFDDDTELSTNCISEIVRTFEKYGPDAVCPKISNYHCDRVNWKARVHWFLLKFFLLRHTSRKGFQKSGFPGIPHCENSIFYTEALSGCGMVISKEVLEKNQFDEKLKGYAMMEDVDISKRLVNAGNKIIYAPDAKYMHLHTASQRLDVGKLADMYVRNHRYLFLKNTKLKQIDEVFFWWSILGLICISIVERRWKYMHGLISSVRKILKIQSKEKKYSEKTVYR